jgi:hypothetical protein
VLFDVWMWLIHLVFMGNKAGRGLEDFYVNPAYYCIKATGCVRLKPVKLASAQSGLGILALLRALR